MPDGDPGPAQTELDGPVREGLRVLLAIEPLLLQNKSRNAVLQQGETTVVGLTDDAENSQGNSSCP